MQTMLGIFGTSIACLIGTSFLLSKRPDGGFWFPQVQVAPAKRACEQWFLGYGVFWISCFGLIVGLEWYRTFDKIHYMAVCGGLATPLLLQPFLAPWLTRDQSKPLLERYSVKANTWIAIFSFIGNYWYTHYFYVVLGAKYTFPSWDVNGVPIALFFATHFYFSFYHTLSNMVLRKVYSRYKPDRARSVFAALVIFFMAYVTAFMETLTISGFSCYSFNDRHSAYTLGSAFYGIYFIVSFPMFLRIDEPAADSELERLVAVEARVSIY